jgi:hypothetical protein
VIRYVCADLEQVGTELARRSAEVSAWLDARAAAASSQYRASCPDAVERTAAEVDLICYQALTAAVLRLAAAASALAGCAADMRESDKHIAGTLRPARDR